MMKSRQRVRDVPKGKTKRIYNGDTLSVAYSIFRYIKEIGHLMLSIQDPETKAFILIRIARSYRKSNKE